MTTGRINQVTILRHRRSGLTPGTRRDGHRGQKVITRLRSGDRPQRSPNPREKADGQGDPIAPTEFLKGRSAAETRLAGARRRPRLRDCDIGPSRGGHRRSVTSASWSTVTDRGLPPDIWFENVSQRPIIHRPHRRHTPRGRAGFRRHHVRPPTDGGRNWDGRPLPGPERCSERSAKGEWPGKYGTVRFTE